MSFKLSRYTPRKALGFLQRIYEVRIAKFLAQYLFFLYWPLYKILDLLGIRFIVNVAPGIGHIALEFEYFFRLQYLEKIDPKKKYVVLLKNLYHYREFLSVYQSKFYFASSSTILYYLALPMLMRYHSLLVDVGLSRMKWYFPLKIDKTRHPLSQGTPFIYQCSPQESIDQHQVYYTHKLNSRRYFPFHDVPLQADDLLKKWGLFGKKICLVHIKAQVMNSTAAIVDPETYIPALCYLRDMGYSFLFVGREKMPDPFHRFGMGNYAESNEATFKNDLLLFKSCEIAITGGSGIYNLADVYNKPFLVLNYWHLNLCPFSAKSVLIPSLIQTKKGVPLGFAEQFELYLKTNSSTEVFPAEQFEARNATGEEILEGTKELLKIASAEVPFTPLQEKFRQIGKNRGLLPFSLSRPSQFFLEQHSHLF